MRINVYQVNEDSDKRNLIFRDYETTVEKAASILQSLSVFFVAM